ncbi:MAG: hypothetical protein OJF50_002228 [Nitrospira sp.]|nr:hypothetical protein [Nitrospira sp.]
MLAEQIHLCQPAEFNIRDWYGWGYCLRSLLAKTHTSHYNGH